jgi:hypothetical protein
MPVGTGLAASRMSRTFLELIPSPEYHQLPLSTSCVPSNMQAYGKLSQGALLGS